MDRSKRRASAATKLSLRIGATVAILSGAIAVGIVAIQATADAAPAPGHAPPATGLLSAAQARKYARWVTLHGKRQLVAPVSRGAVVRDATSLIPWGALKNAGSGLCMSSYPDTVGHGVEQFPCSGSPNQQWVWVYDRTAFALLNEGMVVPNTSQGPENGCLDNRGGVVYANGNPQIMWPCFGDGWNLGLTYGTGIAQTSGTQLLHTNNWGYFNGETWCVSSYPNKAPGTTLSEYVCNKYSLNQSFYGNVSYN